MSLKTDLWAYWKLDEHSGNRIDEILARAFVPVSNTSYDNGKISKCVTFPAYGDALELGNSQNPNPSNNPDLRSNHQFSYAFWFNVATVDTAGYRYCLTLDGTLQVYVVSNIGQSKVRVEITIGDRSITTPHNFTKAVWHYCIVYYDGTALHLDIDGEDAGSDTGVLGVSNNSNYITLGYPNPAGKCSSMVDEFGIWTRALTSDERTQLWNSGDGLPYDQFEVQEESGDVSLKTGLGAHWKLGDAANKKSDSSGSGNTLTEVGDGHAVVEGKIDTAIQFGNQADVESYLAASDAVIPDGTTAFTTSFWIKIITPVTQSTPVLKHSGNKKAVTVDINVNQLIASVFDSNGNPHSVSSPELTLNTWYLILYSWTSGQKPALQINNQPALLAADTVEYMQTPTGLLQIAYRLVDSDGDAVLDELSLWFRVINSKERGKLWNNGDALPVESWSGPLDDYGLTDYKLQDCTEDYKIA